MRFASSKKVDIFRFSRASNGDARALGEASKGGGIFSGQLRTHTRRGVDTADVRAVSLVNIVFCFKVGGPLRSA